MSQIRDLRAELDSNTSLYSGMSNTEVETSLNAKTVSKNKATLSGSELWESTDASEFAALTDSVKAQWLALCGVTSVDPFGPAQPVVMSIFGGGSATVATLVTLRTFNVSRASEIGLSLVKEGHVEMARAL